MKGNEEGLYGKMEVEKIKNITVAETQHKIRLHSIIIQLL